jgi:hypothetical protein
MAKMRHARLSPPRSNSVARTWSYHCYTSHIPSRLPIQCEHSVSFTLDKRRASQDNVSSPLSYRY